MDQLATVQNRRASVLRTCEILLRTLFEGANTKAMSDALAGHHPLHPSDTPTWVNKMNSMLKMLELALDLIDPQDDRRSFTRIRLIFAFSTIWGVAEMWLRSRGG